MSKSSVSAQNSRFGRLFICPTPIGNLQDASPRLLEVLGSVPTIACEDTRVTGRLRHLLGIPNKAALVTYHDHNAETQAERIMARLKEGEDVALVTDAGTPAISDPGYYLVNIAHNESIKIVSLPGPCAATVAVAASGLPSDRFLFVGFPPAKGEKRLAWLSEYIALGITLVGYESPHRILDLLSDMECILAGITIYLGRELTKLNEEHLRGTPGALRQKLEERSSVKGEFVFVVAPFSSASGEEGKDVTMDMSQAIKDLYESGVHPKTIKSLISKWFGVPKSDVFRYLENIKQT